ncbi:sarcosine oxidase, subunit delta [Novimethylophilus kurashikiensis]|jgi:sarcosine oxidase subunit delta|uniref:Sarcosine oxidase, subunit delta n=1 Tax=Novimethylophilus kurashikiensis TaxID=1825523 RepID=A0A2R5F7E4_9PROT|nr:sarcosine oxidase subunit delta [Novimethylophilus kurashikiensis]GBG13468.1 sarcosine oxidase, subunit delta [Novimethylophilus kurashikiensis]
MKLINCPINGVRPVSEFVFGGELREMPDPDQCSDADWATYVHHRNGAPGLKKEWWYHAPSGTWFIAERNTMTEEIVRTYLFGQEEEK